MERNEAEFGERVLDRIIERLDMLREEVCKSHRREDMPEMLTNDQAAKYLKIQPQTLSLWRSQGISPRYKKINKVVRYAKSDLLEYLEENTVGC